MLAPGLAAAVDYPNHPVEFMVPSSAGDGLGMGEAQRAAPDGCKVSVLISELAAAGKLKALAVMADQRIPGMYAVVPTFKERGIDVSVGTWRGLGVPLGRRRTW